MIGKPSAPDGISAGSEASFAGRLVQLLADRQKPVFQLGLLGWGKAKLYANKGEADRIIAEPRFHRQFVGRSA